MHIDNVKRFFIRKWRQQFPSVFVCMDFSLGQLVNYVLYRMLLNFMKQQFTDYMYMHPPICRIAAHATIQVKMKVLSFFSNGSKWICRVFSTAIWLAAQGFKRAVFLHPIIEVYVTGDQYYTTLHSIWPAND